MQIGPKNKVYEEYPELGIEEWHKAHGLWVAAAAAGAGAGAGAEGLRHRALAARRLFIVGSQYITLSCTPHVSKLCV